MSTISKSYNIDLVFVYISSTIPVRYPIYIPYLISIIPHSISITAGKPSVELTLSYFSYWQRDISSHRLHGMIDIWCLMWWEGAVRPRITAYNQVIRGLSYFALRVRSSVRVDDDDLSCTGIALTGFYWTTGGRGGVSSYYSIIIWVIIWLQSVHPAHGSVW